jgi:site-specific DNA-adenine methylase
MLIGGIAMLEEKEEEKKKKEPYRVPCRIPESLYNQILGWDLRFLGKNTINPKKNPSLIVNDILLTALCCREHLSADNSEYDKYCQTNAKNQPEKLYTLTLWGNLFEFVYLQYFDKAETPAKKKAKKEKIKTGGKRKVNYQVNLSASDFLRRLLTDAITNNAFKKYNPLNEIDYLPPPYKFTGYKNRKMCNKTNFILENILKKPNMTYVEPFVGAASLFFSLPLQDGWTYILSDLEKHKVNLLRVIRDYPYKLMEILLNRNYSPEKYAGGENENEHKKFLNDRLNRFTREFYLTREDYQKADNNWRIKSAADFFIIKHHSKIDITKADMFYGYVALIPLLSLKLRKAKAKIFYENALTIMKLYNKPNTIQLLDPPYISTEKSCWTSEIDYSRYLVESIYEKDDDDYFEDEKYAVKDDDDYSEDEKHNEKDDDDHSEDEKHNEKDDEKKKKEKPSLEDFHEEMATNMTNMKKKGCDFIYFCRSTCQRNIKDITKRTQKDKKLQEIIDDYFHHEDIGYHIDWIVLDKNATECFITTFDHADSISSSKPYIESISTYLPKNDTELEVAMKKHRYYR